MESRHDPRIGIVGARMEHLERIESYGVQRVELVMLPRDEADQVQQFVHRTGVDVSVHCPLFRDADYPEYPLTASVMDTDADRQCRSLALIEREIAAAADWHAGYTVVHLQRSVGVLREPVPRGWDEKMAVDCALRGCERVARLADRYGMPVFVENMVSQPLFARPESYLRLFEALVGSRLGICFDVGHAALDAAHYGFGLIEFAEAVAPYVGSLHLHNNQVDTDFDFGSLREEGRQKKYPVHPGQSTDHGWIDVEAVLNAILSPKPDALPTLEVYFALDTDRDAFRHGLDWLETVCRGHWLAGEKG